MVNVYNVAFGCSEGLTFSKDLSDYLSEKKKKSLSNSIKPSQKKKNYVSAAGLWHSK